MHAHITALAAASILLTGAAGAAAVTAPNFTVTFPCNAQTVNQTVTSGKVSIPMVNYSCAQGDTGYFVVISTYAKGFIAKKTAKGAFSDAVAGAAANVKGTIRSDKPIKLGAVAGHDALIDVAKEKAAAHLRVFFANDMQYQVLVVAPAGQESGKAATKFLDSFKLK